MCFTNIHLLIGAILNPHSLKQTLSIFIISLFITSCNSVTINSNWTDTPLTIDGQNKDWDNLSQTYFKDEGVSLGLANNADNLYIIIQFRDPKILRSASKRGFTVWFDKTGGNNRDFGLRYICNPPIDSTLMTSRMNGFNDPHSRKGPKQTSNRRVIEQIIVLHDPEKPGISVRPDGSQGVSAKLDNNNGIYVYEFGIPLQASDSAFYAIGTGLATNISIGFEFGGMDRDKMEQMKQQRQGGGAGMVPGGGKGGGGGRSGGGRAGGGMKGGGGRGGMSGNPKADMRSNMEGEIIWIKTTLEEFKREQ
jgi:hypothetical protein